MDKKFTEHLVSKIKETFTSMTFLQIEHGNPFSHNPQFNPGEIQAVTNLKGKKNQGKIIVHYDLDTCLALAKNIFKIANRAGMDNLIKDALCEISNILIGNIKSGWVINGIEAFDHLPTEVNFSKNKLNAVLPDEKITIFPFTLDKKYNFFVELRLKING